MTLPKREKQAVQPIRILLAEDNPNDAEMARRELSRESIEFHDMIVDGEEEFRRALDDFKPHLVISDYAMPAFDGMRALEITRSRPERIPFIILTGSINEETAVDCLKAGADDYVLKEKIKRLPFAVRDVLAKEQARRDKAQAQEQLRRNEEKFRLIAENSIDCLWQMDMEHRYTYVSPSLPRILGFTPEEFIGTRFSDHAPEQEVTRIGEVARRMLENPQQFPHISIETTMFHKDGSLVPLEVVAKPLFVGDELAMILGSARDISERKQAEAALRENEKRFRELADMLPVVIFETDRQGNIHYANQQASSVFKYPLEDLVTELSIFDMIAPEERDRARDTFAKRLRGEVFGMINYAGLTKSGKRFPMLVRMSPIPADEVVAGFRGIVVDISKEREMLAKLDAIQKRFRILFEFAPDSFFITDLRGRIVEANRQAGKMLQRRQAELIGKSLASRFRLGEEERRQWRKLLTRSNKGLPTEMEEFTLTRPDGSSIVAEISTYPVRIGSKTQILAIARDITAHRQLQTELENHRESLEQLVKTRTRELKKALLDSEANRDRIDTILKSVSDGLIVTDVNKHIILMNTPAEEYLDLRFTECINRKINDVTHHRPLIDLIQLAFDESISVQADVEIVGKTSEAHVLEAAAKPISVKKGKPIGILTTLRDVTRTREIDRLRTEFLSTTAHELRTPLTSIQGFSEILLTRKNLKKADKDKFLSYINRQAVNLAGIISDLLDISRIESGVGFEIRKGPCRLNDIIAGRIELYRLSYRDHRFTTDLQAPDQPVCADKEKIDQIMQNLLSNAVKYSPDGGEVHVNTEIKNDEFRVTIKDRGIGMTRDQVRNIFRKFYRANSSDTAPPGTGLGMSIVKLILDKHGGWIDIDSRPGVGTKVVFAIPIDTNKIDRDPVQGENQP
ncbi:MAG TPA: PAS domain S-box protein [Candidatus Aminicenantes bacterium]|nr:PAS domain S-box protein [Candidatus Aminicenantes bacterium]